MIDRRTPPRGVLPRRAQTWLMVGLAFGILAIIVVTGGPQPSSRPTPPEPASRANPERLRSYQDYLQLLEERARQETAEQTKHTIQPPAPQAPATPAPPDPLAEEKRRRKYESLFAGITVLTQQPEAHLQPPPRERPSRADPSSLSDPADLPATPSLDAIADAAVRASRRQSSSTAAPETNRPPSSEPSAEASRNAERDGPVTALRPLHRIHEGTVLETILKNRLDSTAAAPVDCLVATPIYSQHRQHVLIPAGSRVLGETKPIQTPDATRLAVTFHRLLLPNGESHALTHATALNQTGDAHLHDRVNRHYAAMFGAAGAIGLISGLAQALTTGTLS
ncbi:MAG: TrbI/VirB10 family protein, partial [Dehalococcoidia bacterium]